jgi:hypothetical protein
MNNLKKKTWNKKIYMVIFLLIQLPSYLPKLAKLNK